MLKWSSSPGEPGGEGKPTALPDAGSAPRPCIPQPPRERAGRNLPALYGGATGGPCELRGAAGSAPQQQGLPQIPAA